MKKMIIVLAILLGGCRVSKILYGNPSCDQGNEFDYKPQHICLCATTKIPSGETITCKWVNLPQAFEAQN